MRYLRTSLGTGWEEKKGIMELMFERALFFIPKANPGYEGKMHKISEWLIEFDETDNPGREIGIDESGSPIVSGPNDIDYGFWLDTNMKYSDFSGIEVTIAEFESLWKLTSVEGIT